MNKRMLNTMRHVYVNLLPLSAVMALHLMAFGQRYLDDAIPYQNAATIRTASGFIEIHFTRKAYMGRATPDLMYYSYHRDSIYRTQGGYHGRPLHGHYVERYTNRGLRVLGNYRYGLREGQWQHWDEQGTLRKVSRWRNGKETGKFAIYNEEGHLQRCGYLREGKFEGIISTYQRGDSVVYLERKRYLQGSEVAADEGSWMLRARDWARSLF